MAAHNSNLERGDKITDVTLATGLLKRIQETRALLTITIPDARGIYNSAILDINPGQHYLILDELNPKQGHHQFLEHKKINVRATVKGVEARFTTLLEKVDEENGIFSYRVGFPQVIWNLQRRQSFRVAIGPGKHLPARMEMKDGTTISGAIRDISEAGIGLLFKRDTPGKKGDLLPNCEFTLADGERISCQIQICYTATQGSDNTIYVGARFYNLDKKQKRALSRQVARLQRELIQTLPRDQLA